MRHALIEHALRGSRQRDADAAGVASSVVASVRLLLCELKPLVGELAAGALYRRSVQLARSSLPRAPEDAGSHDELLAPLHRHLAALPPVEAKAGGRALLNAFVDLLVSLIGEPLTHKLLTKAWGGAADPPVAEEKPR